MTKYDKLEEDLLIKNHGDTPNPFVLSKSAPERSKQLSEEIAQRTGQNTRKEMDKRLGVSNSVTYIKCPHCGKTF